MVAKSEVTVEDLADQLKAVQGDVAKLTELLKTIGAQKAENMADDVRGLMGMAQDYGRMGVDEARRRGELAAEEFEETISRNPLTSVLIAVGLGYVFGSFAGRR